MIDTETERHFEAAPQSQTEPVMKLAPIQRKQLSYWVDFRAKRDYTKQQRDHSYAQWYKGGNGWGCTGEGGTGQMLILCWYHHQHKPGSNEWRPAIIIAALLNEIINGRC